MSYIKDFFFRDNVKDFLNNILFHLKLNTVVFNVLIILFQFFAIRKVNVLVKKSTVDIVENKNRKTIIFHLSRGAYNAHIFIEAGLAYSLKLRGHNVIFLTCGGALDSCPGYYTYRKPPNKNSCRNCRIFADKLFDLLGFQHYHYFDMFDENNLKKTINKFQDVTLEKGKEVKYDSVRVGFHAYSTVIRYFKGAEVSDEEFLLKFKRELINSIISVETAKEAYHRFKPDVFFSSHGVYSAWGSMAEFFMNKNTRTCIWGRGYKKPVMRFDRRLWNEQFDIYFNEFRNKKFLSDEERNELDIFLKNRFSGLDGDTALYGFKEKQKNELEEKFKFKKYKKCFVLFPNLPWDASLIETQGKSFSSIYEWIKLNIELFIKKPDYLLLIKIHPSEMLNKSEKTIEDFIKKQYPKLPKNVIILSPDTDISPYSLFPFIDIGLTYSGSIGLEMALKNIPVIVAANPHYAKKGFTYDANEKETYKKIIFSNIKYPFEKKGLLEVYAYFYFIKCFLPRKFVYSNNFVDVGWNIESLNDFLPEKDIFLDKACEYIINNRIYQDW